MLPKRDTGLPHDSVANISQIVTIDKHFLTDCVSILPCNLFEKVQAGLNLILGK
jgi:mRNA interferase MazF